MITKSVQIGNISLFQKTETIRQRIKDEYLKINIVVDVLIGFI